MSAKTLLAKMTSKPGERDALTAALRTIVAGTESEPGTLTYLMHHDDKDEDVVWFYEHYDSQEALDAHSTSDTMTAAIPVLMPLMASRPELTFLTVVGGKGL